MRTLPFSATAQGLAALITITRGATTIRWTTYHSDIIVGSNTWSPAGGSNISNLHFPSDGGPATVDVYIMVRTGGPVEPGDAVSGRLDGWPITIEYVDPDNPASGTLDLIPNATIGNLSEDSRGIATIAVNGPLNAGRGPLTEHYSLTGREDLGDDRCKIPIVPADIGRNTVFVRPDISTGLLAVNDAYGRFRTGSAGTVEDYANVYYECTTAGTTDSTAPTYDPTVGNTTTDGTAVFTARNAWLRYARGQAIDEFHIQFDALPDPRASDSTWFVMGGLYIRSGVYKNFPKIPIRAWSPSTLTVTTFLPVSVDDLPADTQFEIHAGCDLTREQCFSRFNNITNLRAETFVPPSNVLVG